MPKKRRSISQVKKTFQSGFCGKNYLANGSYIAMALTMVLIALLNYLILLMTVKVLQKPLVKTSLYN